MPSGFRSPDVEALLQLAERSGRDDEMQDVALLADEIGVEDPRRPESGHRDELAATGKLELTERPAGPAGGEVALDQGDLPGRVGPARRVIARKQAPQHLVGRPCDRRDGGNAEP